MKPERWEQVKEIYHSALQLDPERREAFLREACAGDDGLLKEVTSLLAQEGNSKGLFDGPALNAVAQALAQDQAQRPQQQLIGHTLSHYRIEKKIGEGGMGEVFLAQDTSLNRQVALKFLPPEMQRDSVARKRFLREAHSAAALDNPFICGIHEVGESEGRDFIVMEYLDGQTLTEKLRRGRLPLDQTLQVAREVAEALQTAHAKGIIHRDLKPANIMLLKTGHAKVMDFGLAKQIVPSDKVALQDESASAMTRTGMTLGTLAYMSPEQVWGVEVDARSDIFSFGLVLYEMLTRTHPFRKENPMDTGSAILHEESKPISAITQGIPPDLEKLVSRCLRKDPERRVQHMDDVKLALEEIRADLDSGRLQVGPAPAKQATSMRLVTGIVAIAALVVIAVAGWYWLNRQRGGGPEPALVAVPLTSYPGYESFPSFSPDGTQVAFQWCPEGWARGKNCEIYVKQIGFDPPSRLTDTPQREYSPAWSPDGLFIAFLRQISTEKVALVLMPQRGGRERMLAEIDVSKASDLQYGPYLAWTPDSKWVITPVPEPTWRLYLFSVETGEKRRLTDPPAEIRSGGDTAPAFSPDGRQLAFSRIEGATSDFCLLRLGEGYKPQSEPERVASENLFNNGFAWTPDGKEIVFSSGGPQNTPGSERLYRVAVSGSAMPRRVPFVSENALAPVISRQGNRLAYAVQRSDTNIWRVDLDGPERKPGIAVPLISSTWYEYRPVFSRDGKRIAFLSTRSGTRQIWVCDSNGSNPQQLTFFGRSFALAPGMTWSQDGQSIAFSAKDQEDQDIYIISANGGVPKRLTTNPATDQWPYWSHDGQSIYFKSNRVGKFQIWKMPADGGDAVQITREPHDIDLPHESPDGRFLYYSEGYPNLVSVWRVAAEGGESLKILDGVHPEAGWTVGRDGIYFFRPPDEKGHSDLSFYQFATGKIQKILTVERPVWFLVEVSPDGRTILYTQLDQTGSDLMLVENFR